MVLQNDIAALIGFACEAVLWGALTILIGTSLLLSHHRRSRVGSVNLPVTIASLLLFGGCTTHFALEFNHFYVTLHETGVVEGFANETKALIGADLLISLCDLLGDFILMYRCWVLWGKNYWVIVLPSLTAVAGFVCVVEVAHLVEAFDPSSPVPPAAIVPLTTAGYALPLCTNVIATGLIVYKIWQASGAVNGVAPRPSMARTARAATAIVVESGVLYLVTQLVFVILVGIKHPAEAIVGVMAVQIYGIAPILIVIRVGLGVAVETTHMGTSVMTAQWATRREPQVDPASNRHVTVASNALHASGVSSTIGADDFESIEVKAKASSLHLGKEVA